MYEILKKNSNYILVGIIILILSIPLIKMDFQGDDMLNSVMKGRVLIDHISFLEFIRQENLADIHTGRFRLLEKTMAGSFYYIFGLNVLAYNLVHWLVVLASYFATGLFFKKLGFSKENLILFFWLTGACWIMYAATPLTSYAIQMPVTLLLMMLSFTNYIDYIQKKQSKFLFYCLLCFILLTLTMEHAFLVIPGILLLNKCFTEKFFYKNKAMYGLFFWALSYFIIILVLRHTYGVGYDGVILGHVSKIPITIIRKLYSELPLIYFLTNLNHYEGLNLKIYTLTVLLVFLSFLISYQLLEKSFLKLSKIKYILCFSLLLQIFPALIIAVSIKYQNWGWSPPYSQIYLQQVGFVIMIILFFQWILDYPKFSSQKCQKVMRWGLSLFLAVFTGWTFLSNLSVTNYYNHLYKSSKEVYLSAVRQGLFNQLPLNAVVLRDKFYQNEMTWNNPRMFKMLADRSDIYVYNFTDKQPTIYQPDSNFQKKLEENLSAKKLNNVFYSNYKSYGYVHPEGYALVGQVSEPKGASPYTKFKIKQIKLYYSVERKKDLNSLIVHIIQDYHLESMKNIQSELLEVFSQHSGLNGIVLLPENITFYYIS